VVPFKDRNPIILEGTITPPTTIPLDVGIVGLGREIRGDSDISKLESSQSTYNLIEKGVE